MTITVGLITKVVTIIIIMVAIIIIITIGDPITIITQTDHQTKAGIIHHNIVELIICRLTMTPVEGGTTSDETVLVEIEEI